LNRYVLFLIASMLFVGSNVGIGKSIVVVVPILLFALLRFVIAVLVLSPLYRREKMKQVSRGEWINLFLQAFFGTFLFTLLMLGGVHRTTAVAAGVITSTIPAVVALLAWVFLRERPGPRAVSAIVLAVIGVVVVTLARDSGQTGPGSLEGDLMVLGAVFCESTYVILSRRLTQTLSPLDICAYTHLFGLLLMIPFGLVSLIGFKFSTVPPLTWVLVVWYALSASIFSFWLWMKGIRHVPGQLAGVFTAMLPVAAATYGIVVLGERPTIAHGVALACVIGGITIASLRPRNVPPAAS
jgi:drug/metabolite transporter (DMT)-like permease